MLFVMLALFSFSLFRDDRAAAPVAENAAQPQAAESVPPAGVPAPVPSNKVAIVLDDAGYTRDVSKFLDLGIPITLAIMPYERYSKAIAQELTEKHIPYILHLPLEPERYPDVDPGKAALLLSMTDDEARAKFKSDIAAVPGITGVSNHMGSAYSVSEPKMRTLLKLVKEEGLFYFDSYTATKTRAKAAAETVGLPFAENTMFLDLKDDPSSMKKELETLKKRTLRRGKAIAIAHVHKKHIVPALAEAIPEFKKAGIEFVYLKDLVQTPGSSHHEHSRH